MRQEQDCSTFYSYLLSDKMRINPINFPNYKRINSHCANKLDHDALTSPFTNVH